MKNIHVIPTDKPSRLIIDTIESKIYLQPILHDKTVNVLPQKIYITSDEEIKFNDYITDSYKVWQWKDDSSLLGRKKIILTTDQDLIKDGVQAIDNEFLEWFVKNPSCEEVRVVDARYDISTLTDDIKKYPNLDVPDYKIIIPRTTQQIINEDYAGGLEMGQIIPKEEAKQETLEEAVQKVANSDDFINGSLFGAKWQQEQMGNSEFLQKLRATISDAEARRLIFEQFKKK